MYLLLGMVRRRTGFVRDGVAMEVLRIGTYTGRATKILQGVDGRPRDRFLPAPGVNEVSDRLGCFYIGRLCY